MRRSIPTVVVTVIGLILLADFIVANPTLDRVAGAVSEWIMLLAAAAALTGAIALVATHGRALLQRGTDRIGSAVLLLGLMLMLIAGFRPGSSGSSDPMTRWLVAALLAPLIASLFALLFFFLLAAIRRGLAIRSRETSLMVVVALAVLVLLLPLGGALGGWLAAAAGWSLSGPIGAVFRGMLIGVAVMGAITAARLLFGVEGTDE
ncbi:MAG: hypothetical protein ACR2KI_04060 [Candidatus Limnocylindria bacterium]